jgi:hypothetical protein
VAPAAVSGAVPNIVAAGAGGRFGPQGNSAGSAGQGFWHGYTVVRLAPSQPAIVEQRPTLDWIGLTAKQHTLQPGQHMTLHGFGREPVGTDAPAQYDDISSPAITHRYDLVEADRQKPYLPKVDATRKSPENPAGYVALDNSVATIDREAGAIKTGGGNHARVYAIGILSVGDKATTWPLVFEPRKNYIPSAGLVLPPMPLPPLHVAAASPAAPPPPPPPPAAPPPPPPPSFGQALPLSLSPKIAPVSFTGTVVPPSPPPVNPAPPSGSAARKEAKQRQAAAAKSEEGSTEGAESLGGDQAREPTSVPGAEMTRIDHPMTARHRVPLSQSFSPLRSYAGPSAWSRDLYYGGGMLLMAFVFALGFSVLRPRPRRRPPLVAAPVWARREARRCERRGSA